MQARTPCGTCDMEDRHDRPLHRAVKNLSSVRLAHQPIPSGLNPPGSRRGCPKTAARLPHDAKRYHETLVILVPLDSSKEESDMVSSSLFFQVLSLLNHQNKTFLDTRVLHHPSSECLQSDSNGWRTGLQIPSLANKRKDSERPKSASAKKRSLEPKHLEPNSHLSRTWRPKARLKPHQMRSQCQSAPERPHSDGFGHGFGPNTERIDWAQAIRPSSSMRSMPCRNWR